MVQNHGRLRAGLYLRRSDPNRQEDSLERQTITVPPYAESKYRVVDTYIDDCAGDAFEEREGLQRLLRDVAAGKLDVIVADESSRLSRANFAEFVGRIVLPLQEAGIVFDTVNKGIVEWTTVVHFVLLAIEQGKNIDEVKNLSRRVLVGMARAALKGQALAGRSAYGFKRDLETGLLCLVPHQAEIVREVFRRAACGESMWTVADDLNARGIPSPRGSERGKTWCASTLAYMVRNRAYIGDAVWGKTALGKYYRFAAGQAVPRRFGKGQSIPKRGKRKEKTPETDWIVVPNAHEAIVDRETFDAANRAVERRAARNGRAGHKSPNPEAYVFSGLVECGHCGYALCGLPRLTRQRVRCECGWRGVACLKPGFVSRPCGSCGKALSIAEGEEAPSLYMCNGVKRYGQTKCRYHSIPEVELLHIVGADLENIIGDPESRRDEIVRTLTEAANVNPIRAAEKRAALDSITCKLKEGARRFLDVPPALAGEITAAMEALKAEQARLTEEVKALEGNAVDLSTIDTVADDVVDHLRLIRFHLIASENRSTVRNIVQNFVERIVVSFDRSAARLDVVDTVRVKYREDAFTVRSLLSDCAILLGKRSEDPESLRASKS